MEHEYKTLVIHLDKLPYVGKVFHTYSTKAICIDVKMVAVTKEYVIYQVSFADGVLSSESSTYVFTYHYAVPISEFNEAMK